MGRLRAFVESLTNKPLTVLLSHGHIDHAPGAVEFEDVYLNSADWPLYRSQCGLAGRQDYLKGNLKDRYEALTAGTLLEGDPDKTFAELTGGMVFDLGGVHLRAVAFPGHTPGGGPHPHHRRRLQQLYLPVPGYLRHGGDLPGYSGPGAGPAGRQV